MDLDLIVHTKGKCMKDQQCQLHFINKVVCFELAAADHTLVLPSPLRLLESAAMDNLDTPVIVRLLLEASTDDIRILYRLLCVSRGVKQHALQVCLRVQPALLYVAETTTSDVVLILGLQAMQQVTVIGDRNANWLKAPNQRMDALSNAVPNCPALQALHLAGAYSWVDDHMLAVLGRTCSQLKVLRMDSCEKVTAHGLLVSTRC